MSLLAAFIVGWLQLVAWEAGWVAAEVGRQPFVIWGPMAQTDSGLYTIQAVLLTSDAYNTNPDVVPIGIAIMAVLTIAVFGTVYMLKRLFAGRTVSQDLAIVTPMLPGPMAATSGQSVSQQPINALNPGREEGKVK